MIEPKVLEEMTRRLSAALPPGLDVIRDDLRRNLRAALEAGLDRLELVTREEFDVQRAVLARTREKLEALEARVEALEQPRPETPDPPSPG